MEEQLTGWGGPRPNSGRKPVKDKKRPLTVYFKESVIKKNGGQDRFKKKITDTFE